jgi:hypothetical protein
VLPPLQEALNRAATSKLLQVQAKLYAGNLAHLNERGWRTFVDVPFLRQLGAQLYELLPANINLNMKMFTPIFNRNRGARYQ